MQKLNVLVALSLPQPGRGKEKRMVAFLEIGWDHTNNSSLLENSAAIILVVIVLSYIIYIVTEIFFEERRVRGARILSIISTLIVILTFATFACYLQNDAAMTTAMATMILVVITGFYAWNTHIQVGSLDEEADLIRTQADSMSEQVAEMHSQTEIMKGQFELAVKDIKREKIGKEMDLLILPLKNIFRQIDSIGVDNHWWGLYTYYRRQATDPIAYDRFNYAVQSVDQNKYLAPKKLYTLVDEFIIRLMDMKRSDDAQHKESLIKATKDLYYKEDLKGGLVEERFLELTAELQALETI